MYNFLLLHEWWMILSIGTIRGVRKALSEIKTMFEEVLNEPTGDPDKDRQWEAIYNASKIMTSKIKNGKRYVNYDEALQDLDTEITFQEIVLEEQSKRNDNDYRDK